MQTYFVIGPRALLLLQIPRFLDYLLVSQIIIVYLFIYLFIYLYFISQQC
jgi:hypothetical protein